jgi:serine/threonine-protein kinase
MTPSEWTKTARIAGFKFRPTLMLLVSAALVPSALTAPSAVAAAGRDEVGARVLFAEGRRLADAGRYAEACLEFEESLRLDPGVGTSFNLADCEEHLGRTASAWARFLEVAAATKLERQRVARARAAALEPRLARLAIEVRAPPAVGQIVERDGGPVGIAAWGIAVPVDPGPHLIASRAPGRKNWAQSVTVPDGPGTTVVSVPTLEARSGADPRLALGSAPSTGAPAPLVDATASTSAKSASAATPAPAVGRWSLPVLALGALGAVGLTTGAALALAVSSENNEAMSLCPGSSCQDLDEKARHDGLVEDARSHRVLAVVGAGVGAAALLAAAYLWWRPGHATSSSPKAAGASRLEIAW